MENRPEETALAPWLSRAEAYVRRSKAPNTLKAYQSDWRAFESFCRAHARPSLPAVPETVAAYIAECAASLKANTVERRLAAISQAHQLAGCPNPTEDKLVRTVMAGIRRAKGTARKGKDPLSPALLRSMFAQRTADVRGIRDRALLLVGFAGALRRTELVALRCENVRFTEEGLVVTIPQSKTDQEGEGQTVGIPYGSHPETCPVRALHAWLESSGVTAGHLFRAIGRWGREVTDTPIGDHQLAKIIKRLAHRAGLDPSAFSGHSLRSGLATSAAEGGATERSIMDQTRHKSLKQVRTYMGSRAGTATFYSKE